MHPRKRLFVLIGLLLALALGWGLGTSRTGTGTGVTYTEPGRSPSQSAVGIRAAPAPTRPEAPNLTFMDESGAQKRLSDFVGQVILVNLWATWCPPCVAEMPDLDQLQQTLGGPGFRVIAISLDRGGLPKAKAWMERNKTTALVPYWSDPANHLGRLLPTTFLIDAHGRVAWKGEGLQDWLAADSHAALAALISEKS